jgi:hypothetical protein
MKNHSSLHIDQHKQSFRNGVFQQNQEHTFVSIFTFFFLPSEGSPKNPAGLPSD